MLCINTSAEDIYSKNAFPEVVSKRSEAVTSV